MAETISPLVCRLGSKGLVAMCDGCGLATNAVHIGLAFHGWYCAACCPADNGTLCVTEADAQHMEAELDAQLRMERLPEDAAREVIAPGQVNDLEKSLMMRDRWRDPDYRQAMITVMRHRQPKPITYGELPCKTLHVEPGFSGTGCIFDFLGEWTVWSFARFETRRGTRPCHGVCWTGSSGPGSQTGRCG
jgi:hypothetical protein